MTPRRRDGPPRADVPSVAPGAAARRRSLLCVYGGLALTVDFPRAAIGIQSDEATYYMMGHSLADDGDLTYRREDLVRVWREFPSGPTGVFLKKGRTIERVGLMLRPPFFWTPTRPTPTRTATSTASRSPTRCSRRRSFALFGTNGFLVLNALLLAAAASAATCSSRRARGRRSRPRSPAGS